MATRNLGQVAGVHIGSTPPDNVILIWYDNTPSQMCHKVYDPTLKQWVIIDQKIISRITYSELVNIAKNTGLSIGKFYQISDKGNVLAISITTTKIQYVDALGNILIDDLGTNIQYHVTSSNLSIDGVKGVFDEVNKTLVFRFDEHSINFVANDYIMGEVKRNNEWRLAKFRLSSLLSTVTGNSISWNGGFFFNFAAAIKGILDKKGGVVAKDSYDSDMENLNTSIQNVGKENQNIIKNAQDALDKAVTAAAIYGKRTPPIGIGGDPIDIATGDTLLVCLSKLQRYINKFKYATGIKLSQSFTPSEGEDIDINNNDTVETAFAKVQKSLNNLKDGMINIYGDSIKTSKNDFPVYSSKPDDISNNDSIAQAIAKLVYLVNHIETSFIKDYAITINKIVKVGALPTDIMRIELTSNVDLSDCGFGGTLIRGSHNYLFYSNNPDMPYNPYPLDESYSPNTILAFAPLTTTVKNSGHVYVTASPLIHYTDEACTFQFQIMLDDEKLSFIQQQSYTKAECSISADIYGYLSTTKINISVGRIMWFDINLSEDTMKRGSKSHIIFKVSLAFSK